MECGWAFESMGYFNSKPYRTFPEELFLSPKNYAASLQ